MIIYFVLEMFNVNVLFINLTHYTLCTWLILVYFMYISCIYHVYIMYILCIYYVYIMCIWYLNWFNLISDQFKRRDVKMIVHVNRSISGTVYWPTILMMIAKGSSWIGSCSLPAVFVGVQNYCRDTHEVMSWHIN